LIGVVVAAAGLGRRLGDMGPKALVPLAGRPLLAYALDDLQASRVTAAVVVVAPAAALDDFAKLMAGGGWDKVVGVVGGGATRQASVAAGLAALPPGLAYVAVHDAARPLAGGDLLDRLLQWLVADPDGVPGVVPGLPVTDTIRRVDAAGRSLGIVDRDLLRAMQTPQLFLREVLEEAHRRAAAAGIEATDEAALVELAGYPVRVVPGSPENIKVTVPADLAVAEAILHQRRRGA
jgi:2-C-methyl-D-erythritol 4-phosphate cytidylyltransferase